MAIFMAVEGFWVHIFERPHGIAIFRMPKLAGFELETVESCITASSDAVVLEVRIIFT